MAHISIDSNVKQDSQRGVKRSAIESVQVEHSQKKPRLLLTNDDSSEDENGSASEEGGVPLENGDSLLENGFSVNQDFARRFEHNKKREELHRLQEKYKKPVDSTTVLTKNDDPDLSDSSTDTEEDDEGILASEVLDAQIQDTLQAIKNKDPRVYDDKVKFFTEPGEESEDRSKRNIAKAKPMYLSDYHRRNLLEGDDTSTKPSDQAVTYVQQQDNLRNDIVKEMHATAKVKSEEDAEDSEDGFLIRKPLDPQHDSPAKNNQPKRDALDVEAAEKDPEAYLSKFMEARAWVPTDNSRFQPFESDDEDEERQAELFEQAYNLRFEDPNASNEKLMSHARDAAARYSVRKEIANPRKKARENERAKKEAARQTREEEKGRLRKLKVAEAEEKIKKIKQAAGLRGESFQNQDWAPLIEEGWDDLRWEEEMKKRFGDDYYADREIDAEDDHGRKDKRNPKKPRWEDDIEIKDLIPDFEAGDDQKPRFQLSEDELNADTASVASKDTSGRDNSGIKDEDISKKPTARRKANQRREKDEQKKADRQERQKIERLVDQQLNIDASLSNFSKKHAGQFRYRETSPAAFGLTSHDILMASDSQLNQYAGLKKLAAFRDSEKKRKDKKHLGKKARLRQWRKDTFGDAQGPTKTLAESVGMLNDDEAKAHNSVYDTTGKKRRKKKKT